MSSTVSSASPSRTVEAKMLGAACAGAIKTGHQNGVPRQPSSSRPSCRDNTRIGWWPTIFRAIARSCIVCGASENLPSARFRLSRRPVPPQNEAIALFLRRRNYLGKILNRSSAGLPIEAVARLKVKAGFDQVNDLDCALSLDFTN